MTCILNSAAALTLILNLIYKIQMSNLPLHRAKKHVKQLLMIYCNPIILTEFVYILCQKLQSITNAWPAALVLCIYLTVFLRLMLHTFPSCLERNRTKLKADPEECCSVKMNYCINRHVVSFTRLKLALFMKMISEMIMLNPSFKKYIYTGKQVKHLP